MRLVSKSRVKERQTTALWVWAFVAVVFFFPTDASAYVDPGAGSMILQVILGGVAGLLVAGKLFWRRIVGVFGRNRDDKTTPNE